MDEHMVAHQFDDAPQQRHAAELGMWIFLANEVLFFGGLFTAYVVYRLRYPEAFAEGSGELYMWIGASNTAVLLLSSYAMVLAVEAARSGHKRRCCRRLVLTAALGGIFLALKSVEYILDFHEAVVPGLHFRSGWVTSAGGVELFFILYFVMTLLHALHMVVGVGLIIMLTRVISRSDAIARHANAVDMVGLYWHFVDIVWIFLFPLLYLVHS